MTENLQDKILEDAKEKGIEVVIYLTRGNRIVGKVLDQDKYTVLLKSEKRYKLDLQACNKHSKS